MRIKNNFIWLILSLMLVLGATALGQQTAGTIEGTIKDPQGAVIPGVSVTVSGINVGFNRTVESNDEGVYRLQQVPPGTYRISTGAVKGFSSATVDNVNVVIEKVTTADVSLSINAVAQVDVTGDQSGAIVDSTDNKIQTNITAQQIESLPKGLGFVSVLRASPSVTSNTQLNATNGSETGYLQIDGASTSENAFVIDGQEVTNFRSGTLNRVNNIPNALVQEVQVKSSGFEAEHGGASGGVIVVGTKSGTDQWRGEFGAMFEPSKLQPASRGGLFAPQVARLSAAPYTQVLYSFQSPRDQYISFLPTATLGGPIKEGRAWFIGSWSPQIFESTRTTRYYSSITPTNTILKQTATPAQDQVFTGKQIQEYGFGRVDASVTNNVRVFASYLWNPSVFQGFAASQYFPTFPQNALGIGASPLSGVLGGTTYVGSELARQQGGRTNSNNFSTQGTWTPSQNAVVSARFGRSFMNEKGGSAYGIPNGTRVSCNGIAAGYPAGAGCTFGFSNFGSNNLVTKDVSIRKTLNADITYILGNFGGSHNIKGGYEAGRVSNDVKRGYADTGQITLYYGETADDFGYAPSFCPPPTCIGIGEMVRFGTQGIASNRYNALYVQDKWQPFRRLTVNLGLRAENENLPSFNTGGNTGTGTASSGIPVEFGWADKIAPRLGAAFDVRGDGKSRLFASYGKFYDRLKFELPRGSFGGDFYRVDDFPIFSDHPEYTYYTKARILGTFTDPIGGGNPSLAGGLSRIQFDFRIPSNLTAAQFANLGLPLGGVDPDLKPFNQTEMTVGYEQELWNNYRFQARFTHKYVNDTIEDQANLGVFESEAYIIGNPGKGLAFQQRKAAGYVKQAEVERDYKALELSLDRRMTSNFYYNLSYTFSRLFGNYSGLASSDENGRASPGAARFFDYAVNGFTATGAPDNGRLATDRPHIFKGYGAYVFDWWKSQTNSTEFSFFQTLQSGTPQTTFVNVGSTSIPLSVRGNLGRTSTFSQTDLSVKHMYKFGRDDRIQLISEINVINVFNQNIVTALNTTRYVRKNTLGGVDLDPCYNADGVLSTAAKTAGCTTANTLLTTALNNILNGKIGAPLASLESMAGNINAAYGMPSTFQAPRNIRFGFRIRF